MTQARVLRNDARIMDAAIEALAEDGWAGATASAVGRRCGLSHRAVQARFPTKSDLAVMAWRDRVGPVLQSALADALDGAGLLETEGPTLPFAHAMSRLAMPDVPLRAAAEVLVMANFDQSVRTVTAHTLGPQVEAWCTRRAGTPTRPMAARRAWLLVLALGLLAAGRRPGLAGIDLTDEFARVHRALQADVAAVPLPTARPAHVFAETRFDTGDAIRDALLVATLDKVADVGFEAATTLMISRAVGVSETAIFMRYPTKLAMFVDAATRQQAIAFRANEQFTKQVEDLHGRAIAEAVNIREFLRPDLARQRAIYAETIRVSWHDTELRDRQEQEIEVFVAESQRDHPDWPDGLSPARAHLSFATGIGYALLPIVAPEAWELPYDVVTRPLVGEG